MTTLILYYQKTNMIMQKIISILFISLFLISTISAQDKSKRGIIKGHLIDLVTGEGLIGANVLVDGLTLGAASDVDGNYTINNVPVGTYNLTVTCVSYKTTKIQNVTVETDKITLLNSTVESSVQALGEIVV